jgi:3-oxoacyl-[acyl-carrier protein] reductase
MFELSGRTALVTGAGRGVGRGIARVLAAQGARVAVNDVDAGRAEATAKEIEAAGGRALATPFDVTDPGAVAGAVERIAAQLGPIDVLVNNAGIPLESRGMQKKFIESGPDDWAALIDINLYGAMHCIRAVLPGMVTRGFGRIIQISSGASQRGLSIGVSSYGAAKSGIEGLIRLVAVENARSGVTANSIALGLMNNQKNPGATAHIAAGIPMGRLGEPEEAGALCAFLASNESAYVTGQTIHLNGGSITT